MFTPTTIKTESYKLAYGVTSDASDGTEQKKAEIIYIVTQPNALVDALQAVVNAVIGQVTSIIMKKDEIEITRRQVEDPPNDVIISTALQTAKFCPLGGKLYGWTKPETETITES